MIFCLKCQRFKGESLRKKQKKPVFGFFLSNPLSTPDKTIVFVKEKTLRWTLGPKQGSRPFWPVDRADNRCYKSNRQNLCERPQLLSCRTRNTLHDEMGLSCNSCYKSVYLNPYELVHVLSCCIRNRSRDEMGLSCNSCDRSAYQIRYD